ncbi:hypothetical protein LTR85_006770 [Meristemomyces frigidus]|nr:hypothetical protein LTR85_006770 [Meristemomyces frigidus]
MSPMPGAFPSDAESNAEPALNSTEFGFDTDSDPTEAPHANAKQPADGRAGPQSVYRCSVPRDGGQGVVPIDLAKRQRSIRNLMVPYPIKAATHPIKPTASPDDFIRTRKRAKTTANSDARSDGHDVQSERQHVERVAESGAHAGPLHTLLIATSGDGNGPAAHTTRLIKSNPAPKPGGKEKKRKRRSEPTREREHSLAVEVDDAATGARLMELELAVMKKRMEKAEKANTKLTSTVRSQEAELERWRSGQKGACLLATVTNQEAELVRWRAFKMRSEQEHEVELKKRERLILEQQEKLWLAAGH